MTFQEIKISEANEKRLKALLDDSRFEEISLSLNLPNIFSVLGVQGKELQHSGFLAWLLDPLGSHSLGDVFLRRFLRGIGDLRLERVDLSSTKVIKETNYIDILIDNEFFVVVIENKIWSSAHSLQLPRYRERFSSDKRSMKYYVYLTPSGTAPSADQIDESWLLYSYKDILDHLERIIGTRGASISNQVATYLKDYVQIIRRNLLGTDHLNDIAASLYIEHREAIEFIIANAPDLITLAGEYYEQLFQERSWRRVGTSRGWRQFVTKDLDDIYGGDKLFFQLSSYGPPKTAPSHISFSLQISSSLKVAGPAVFKAVSELITEGKLPGRDDKKLRAGGTAIYLISETPQLALSPNNEQNAIELRKAIDSFWNSKQLDNMVSVLAERLTRRDVAEAIKSDKSAN